MHYFRYTFFDAPNVYLFFVFFTKRWSTCQITICSLQLLLQNKQTLNNPCPKGHKANLKTHRVATRMCKMGYCVPVSVQYVNCILTIAAAETLSW